MTDGLRPQVPQVVASTVSTLGKRAGPEARRLGGARESARSQGRLRSAKFKITKSAEETHHPESLRPG